MVSNRDRSSGGMTLSVLTISAFVPGSDTLRRDLAAILSGSTQDAASLIKNFRIAALSGSEAVNAIDQRIQADPLWSGWVQIFLKESKDLLRLCRAATQWEFSESEVTQENSATIRNWLFRR